ncbi:hypothetical protein BGX29_008016 [Mortierella sp. GBA35]|nr:hypothetical protein BGX29_008016 [Mortierella sp. GBA35]
MIMVLGFSSAFDSRLSTRSSTSSSISGWAPRARSSSVSSQGSNDSVNLDALIAGGSDINEECPLDLEDADDVVVDWSKEEQEEQLPLEDPLPVPVQHGQRSRRSTGASATSSLLYDDRHSDEYWDEPPEMTEEDPEFDETLKGFSQLSMKNAIPAVRGLAYAGQQRSTATGSSSSRFPDGRNPFDLDADYLNTPSGLTSPTNRLSTLSQDSNISSRSSISSIGGSRLQPPGVSRLPGAPGSGLKAPASRLAQPGSRSGVPQPGSKVGITRPTGLQAPKSGSQAPKTGIQAPKTGIQAPKTGLQAPRTGLQAPRTGSSSSLVKPSTNGRTTSAIGSRLAAPSRVPSKAGSGIAAPSTTTTRSHIVAPGSNIKRAASVSTGNRNSTLPPPSTVASRSASSSTLVGRSNSTIAGSRTMTSPQRTGAITPSQLASPTRVSSGRLSSSSSHMVSPTSSQSSTSSLSSFAHARDTVTPLSQRLSNATGTSQLMRPKTVGTPRSVSMYGSSSLLPPTGGRNHHQQQQHHYQQQEDEVEYAVLTPPQSPSSKRVMSGLPRSGMATPSRLTAPSVSTSRVPRSMSPAPLSAGSNSGGSSYLPRPHTPTSSLPGSRILSGIVSPRAGRS